jgi:hypothetical protein
VRGAIPRDVYDQLKPQLSIETGKASSLSHGEPNRRELIADDRREAEKRPPAAALGISFFARGSGLISQGLSGSA